MIRRVSSTTVRPTSSAVAVAAHPGRGGLEDLELGGACLGLLEQLGVGRAIAACVASVVMNATSPLVQARGSRRDRRQGAETRSWWMSGAIRWPATSKTPSYRSRACWRSPRTSGIGQDVPGAQDLADPALVAPEDRQAPGERRRGGPAQAATSRTVVAQDPDRRGVGAQGALGLVDDHPEEVGPIVRGGQPSGDAEDRVESLGELGLEGAARRRGMLATGRAGGGRRSARRARIG